VKSVLSGVFAAILAFAGCTRRPPPPPLPAPHAHYVLGGAYQAGGHWFYPAEDYALDTSGIATTLAALQPRLTNDGELYDPTALTAAMQTIQLPAIVTVTNLDNGRQIDVRVNQRGPADPARLIALSPRAALFLQIPESGAARVHVQANTQLSHRLVDQLGGGPKLTVQAAPLPGVTAQALPPPGGGRAGQAVVLGGAPAPASGPTVPDRLPEVIHQMPVHPGALYLRAGSFGRFNYANQVAAQLGGLGGDVIRSREGRQEVYAVRAGPFSTIPQADAALREALRDGVADAHITVE
jgi:rare lipoprotein A